MLTDFDYSLNLYSSTNYFQEYLNFGKCPSNGKETYKWLERGGFFMSIDITRSEKISFECI